MFENKCFARQYCKIFDENMMNDISLEDSMNASLEASVCIDDAIFSGPITAKEKLVRERFEKRQKEKVKEKSQLMPSFKEEIAKECPEYKMNTPGENKNEIINDSSLYESFSIDETKYDSFEDSLDEGNNIYPKEVNIPQFPPEQVNVNFRKSRNKQIFRGSLCDSLEDIHSLVSNVEKLSISEDIENINILEKNHIYDDSLRNDICFENKNTNSAEQNFDDDSLAILEFEKTFDDSLEEADLLPLLRNGMSDAEISVENLTKENVCVTKNLFETSVEIIYENVRNVGIAEVNCEIIKPSTGDSLSISENMSKDSLDDQLIQQQPHEKAKETAPTSITNDIPDVFTKTEKSKDIDTTKSRNNIEVGLNSKIAPNFLNELNDLINEEPVVMGSALNSNDEILIEDSCSLSSNTEYDSAESKLSFNENILSKANETIVIDDSILINSLSAEENHYNSLEKKFAVAESNDTICIDDSFIVPNDSYVNKETSMSQAIIHCKKEIIFPIKDKETESPEKNNETISDLNDTINIDDSVNVPMKPALNKRKESSSKNISKTQSINDKNHKEDNLKTTLSKNCATSVQNSESILPFSNKVEKVAIANALNSNLNECIQSNVQDASEFKIPKNENEPCKDAFVHVKGLSNETSLKLQVEVAFDNNQGLNIISISAVDQHPQNEQNAVSEINTKKVTVGITNENSNLNNHSEKVKSSRICKINNPVEKNMEKRETHLDVFKPNSEIEYNSKQIRMLPDKKYADVQVEFDMCDAQLLKALDLHNASYNTADNKYLQSRDSIMPLNLCIRNSSKSQERDTPFLKSEGKENIPINYNSSKNLEKEITSSDHSKRSSDISQKAKNKTPKHFNTIVDAKKSGNKTNSATKIPVRKVDSTFPTPVHQKIGKNYNPIYSTEKSAISPIVKSASETDSLSSIKLENTARKLHFCTVRNSISRVPKSSQRPTPKKFQYIESPVAKYIGKSPLKTTHRYDGNVVFGNASKTGKSTAKTPSSTIKGSPKISPMGKV
ncbi:uncharacterized protein NPIL_420901 [Nephila pilipes]|uniref:Uncharacterized protein n=1 Tax=Nephila pilipes TaxID=299642 RepID=A0A8X6QBC9_NEPPI|nr:uncharacterized protein NPIL_420901 [Nephila pilipes]